MIIFMDTGMYEKRKVDCQGNLGFLTKEVFINGL